MEPTSPDTLDLRDYLAVLQRRWILVAAITAAVVLASQVVALLTTPVYQGQVQLAIEPVRGGDEASIEDLLLRNEIVETERLVLTSRPVSQRVITALDLDVTPTQLAAMVNVTVVRSTRVVQITATNVDPVLAAQVADGYAAAYLDYRRDRAIEEITAARTNIDARARSVAQEIVAIDAELATIPAGSVLPDDVALRARRDALSLQVSQLGQTLAALDPGAEAIRGGGEVLIPAEIPNTPIAPRPLRSGALALVLGLMLGVGLAFLLDHFDDAIRGDDDISRVGGGRPVLGRITHWERKDADERLITVIDPHDSASEEFSALAANLRFSLLSRSSSTNLGSEFRSQSMVISSGTPGEGKSSVSGNVAVAAAGMGMRVILVGADMRRPTAGERFGIPKGVGLSDLLVDARQLSSPDRIAKYLIDVGTPRLRVLPAGTIPPNPTELLASSQFTWLHECLTGMADLVIYDTPPLLPVADTLQIAPHVDMCVVIARTTKANKRQVQHAVERLDGVGADVAGFVINDVAVGKRSVYGYGYGYGYGYKADSYRPRDEGQQLPGLPKEDLDDAGDDIVTVDKATPSGTDKAPAKS